MFPAAERRGSYNARTSPRIPKTPATGPSGTSIDGASPVDLLTAAVVLPVKLEVFEFPVALEPAEDATVVGPNAADDVRAVLFSVLVIED